MSDGTDALEELLEKAVAIGIKTLSVTDHDDIRSAAVILSALKAGLFPIEFITGAEFASVYQNHNMHLLAYGFDPESDGMKLLGMEAAHLRRQRIMAMFEHLSFVHDIIIPEEAQAEILYRIIPGKIHIAAAAKKLGYDMPRRDFIANFLNDIEDRQYKINAERIIRTVTEAGGIVSMAHPIETQKEHKLDLTQLSGLIKKLKGEGLGAIEVFHSSHGRAEVAEYRKFAQKYDLKVSGGSDYHGTNKTVPLAGLTAYGYVPRRNELTVLSNYQKNF